MGLSSVIREVIVLASRTKVEIDVPVRMFVIILILLNRTDYLCVPMIATTRAWAKTWKLEKN